MKEEIWYFESELSGMALKRSIDLDNYNDKDSIETALKTIPFDTLKINNSHYIRARNTHKKL